MHKFTEIPPFDNTGEVLSNDYEFRLECETALNSLLERKVDLHLEDLCVSINNKHGIVGRASFSTPYDLVNSINYIMFWKLPDGEFVEFVGFNVMGCKD